MSPEDEGRELDDKFHDECGLFGVWNHAEAANVAYLGLYALQHRGQESAGIAATDGHAFHVEKAMGWVADVFSRDRLRRLPGNRAMGHVRYSTAGSSSLRNAQPITATTAHGPVAIAHNGNLINAEELRRQLEADGAVFQSSSDTEVILHLLARAEGGTLVDQLARALAQGVLQAQAFLMAHHLMRCRLSDVNDSLAGQMLGRNQVGVVHRSPPGRAP